MSRLLQRLTGGVVSRPAATTGIVLALAIAGGVLALGLRPSAGIDTFVSGTSPTYRATVAQQRLFGVNGIQILVSEPLTTLLSPSALERVSQLEACLGGQYDTFNTTLAAYQPVASGGHAAYPLRLAGVQVGFIPPSRLRSGKMRIGPIRAAAGSGPFPATALLVRNALPAATTTFPAGPNGTPQGDHSAEITWLRKSPAIPAIATTAFLAATRQHVGSVVSLPINNAPVKMRIVASVSAFPTIPAAGGGLILDSEPLQQTLLASGALPLAATQWWLRAARTPDFRGIATGLQATSRTAVAASMTGNPFDVDVRLALIAIAAAAVILAIAGFAVGAAAARERRPELALLDALGMPRRQLTRMLRTEQALLAVPSAAAGLALGVVLAHLIVPPLTLTPTGGASPVPVMVEVPWPVAVAMAAIIAAFPVIVAPLTGRASDTVAVLRQGAQE
jgi:hypothetical protein